ncbi:MAG: diguanylate cyclase, partial [Actinomycetota bacterium]|nr:diguanylate cyclase [Actinomycetota bacterium]
AAVHHGLDQLVTILQRLRAQAQALADGRFDAPVLAQSAEGPLGEALAASIERLRRTTADLRDSEQMARAIIDTASESILVLDDAGDIIQANQAALADLGNPALAGRSAASLIPDWRSLVGGSSEIEIEIEDTAGSRLHVLVSGSSFQTDHGQVTILIWRDITARKDGENRLKHLAHHDSLTDLLNRSGMKVELARRESEGATTSVVNLDVDRFKPLNDLHGHDMGDFALTEIARRLPIRRFSTTVRSVKIRRCSGTRAMPARSIRSGAQPVVL